MTVDGASIGALTTVLSSAGGVAPTTGTVGAAGTVVVVGAVVMLTAVGSPVFVTSAPHALKDGAAMSARAIPANAERRRRAVLRVLIAKSSFLYRNFLHLPSSLKD
jgi:NADPH:quinone reductase-like Zn-dependent oxidoreductase